MKYQVEGTVLRMVTSTGDVKVKIKPSSEFSTTIKKKTYILLVDASSSPPSAALLDEDVEFASKAELKEALLSISPNQKVVLYIDDSTQGQYIIDGVDF